MRSRTDSIRYAASFVLAGCAPSTPTTPIDTTRTAAPPPDPSVLVVVDPPPPDPVPQPLPTVTVQEATPQETCQAYRERIDGTDDDPRRQTVAAAKGPPQLGHDVRSQSVRGWATGDGKVMCTIIWEQKAVTTTVMHHPTCCPMPGKQLPCPQPQPRQVQGTALLREQVTIVDGQPTRIVDRVVTVPPQHRHACGRRPEGLAFVPPTASSPGDVLATMAVLEAASIAAFDRLARELEAHGAPAPLVARARSAMADEIRHTRLLRRLARARGGRPIAWRRAALPVRSRRELGVENAAEGCVSEAFGAATALVQAERAADPEVRRAFGVIAREELEHAALAWDVHDWLMETGTPDERTAIAHALGEAAGRMGHVDPGPSTRETLGLPDAETSRRLLAKMVEQLGLAA